LAELVQPLAAALAARARRRFDDTFDRKVVRQRTSGRPWIARELVFGGFRCCGLGFGFLFGLGLFEVLDGKFELLDQQLATFGGLSAMWGSAPPVSAPSEGSFLDAKRGSHLGAI
jgi:hypothetical protein